MLKPNVFKVGGKKYYLTDIMNIINSDLDTIFFEFIVVNADAYSPDRVLVFANHNSGKTQRVWRWFVYMKYDEQRTDFSYHYRDLVLPEKDFFLFADYVKKKTPEALPYILFNYIVWSPVSLE